MRGYFVFGRGNRDVRVCVIYRGVESVEVGEGVGVSGVGFYDVRGSYRRVVGRRMLWLGMFFRVFRL